MGSAGRRRSTSRSGPRPRPATTRSTCAGTTCCPASSTCTAHRRRRAGDARRVRLQALDGARHHHDPRSGLRQRLDWMLDQQAARAPPTRSPRRASCRTCPSAQGANEPITKPEEARALGATRCGAGRRRASSSSAAGPTSWRPRSTRPKKLGLRTRLPPRAARRGARQRARPPRAGASPRWSTGTACPRRCSTTARSRTTRATTTTTTSSTASARPGRLWRAGARRPAAPRWNAVMEELLEARLHDRSRPSRIYEASRDLMRARRAEWHDEYTLPSLWDFYPPNRDQPRLLLLRLDDRRRGRLAATTTGSG